MTDLAFADSFISAGENINRYGELAGDSLHAKSVRPDR
jgi:hypothetical protein